MPKYNKQCRNCGKLFEEYKTFDEFDEHKTRCPKCNSKKVKNVIPSTPVVYKDEGFTLHKKGK